MGNAIEVPILDEAAEALKQSGRFQAELSGAQLADILAQVVDGLLAGQSAVQVGQPELQARIENQRGTVVGRVQVYSPITADIGLQAQLGNDPAPGRIRLLDLQVEERAGLAAKMALRAANLKGRARAALADPNQALFEALAGQLRRRGARLSDLALHFNERSLSAELAGSEV